MKFLCRKTVISCSGLRERSHTTIHLNTNALPTSLWQWFWVLCRRWGRAFSGLANFCSFKYIGSSIWLQFLIVAGLVLKFYYHPFIKLLLYLPYVPLYHWSDIIYYSIYCDFWIILSRPPWIINLPLILILSSRMWMIHTIVIIKHE